MQINLIKEKGDPIVILVITKIEKEKNLQEHDKIIVVELIYKKGVEHSNKGKNLEHLASTKLEEFYS